MAVSSTGQYRTAQRCRSACYPLRVVKLHDISETLKIDLVPSTDAHECGFKKDQRQTNYPDKWHRKGCHVIVHISSYQPEAYNTWPWLDTELSPVLLGSECSGMKSVATSIATKDHKPPRFLLVSCKCDLQTPHTIRSPHAVAL